MDKDIIYYARNRHSAKTFNPTKKISNENIDKIKELLRLSASSTNAQPWHFVLASSDEAKSKIAKATEAYPFNTQAILDASHIIIFCSKTEIKEDYLLKILEQETVDGRFNAAPEFRQKMHEGRSMFVNMHKNDLKDIEHWMGKQVYLNAGSFLLGISTLGINALPMEGVQFEILDEEFDLQKKGYTSLMVIPIGYNIPENDYNANIPKSRLEYSEILTEV